MIAVADITRVMGGRNVLGRAVRSLAELEGAVGAGLPKSTLGTTIRSVVSDRREARRVHDRIVPPATFKRRRKTLSTEESERVERLARTIATAFYIWNDRTKAQHFLLTPHPLLEGRRPLEVAATDLGARRVEDLLWGLFYGLPI